MSRKEIIGYLGENHLLTDDSGKYLGIYHIVATWKTPKSYLGHQMHQVEAFVKGRWYTGRSIGKGMSFRGFLMSKPPRINRPWR